MTARIADSLSQVRRWRPVGLGRIPAWIGLTWTVSSGAPGEAPVRRDPKVDDIEAVAVPMELAR